MRGLTALVPLIATFILMSSTLGEPVILSWPSEEWPITKVDNTLVLELNLWNLKSARGSAVLVSNKGLTMFYANLYDVLQVSSGGWVTGYPEIFYGYKPWNRYYVNGRWLKLPLRIKELPTVYLIVNYTIWAREPLSLNFAYDLWITKDKFSRRIGKEDVEVMIWLYHTELTPAGKRVEMTVMPVNFNGEEIKLRWEVWLGKADWTIVTFKPCKLLIGKVKLKLNDFILKTKDLVKKLERRDILSHYLEDVELGSEFGDPYTRKATFGWIIYNFNILGET